MDHLRHYLYDKSVAAGVDAAQRATIRVSGPQQLNFHDCGMYVLGTMSVLSRNIIAELTFSAADITALRRRLILEIVMEILFSQI